MGTTNQMILSLTVDIVREAVQRHRGELRYIEVSVEWWDALYQALVEKEGTIFANEAFSDIYKLEHLLIRALPIVPVECSFYNEVLKD